LARSRRSAGTDFSRRISRRTLALVQDRPGLEDILPTMLMPCCLYAGEMDPIYPEVEECSRHIPRVTFFSLPGLSHCEAYARSEFVLPRVTGFFKALNTS
jgi:hypothetical protein